MQTVTRLFNLIEKAVNSVIITLLMVMTVAIFYQVVLRYVFKGANIWAEELARYSFIWVVMLGSSSALRRFKHIRIDFLVERFSQKTQKLISLFNYILMLLFLIVLIVYGIEIAARTGGRPSAGLGVSTGFMYSSIPVGAFLMLLFTLEIVVKEYLPPKTEPKQGGDA